MSDERNYREMWYELKSLVDVKRKEALEKSNDGAEMAYLDISLKMTDIACRYLFKEDEG